MSVYELVFLKLSRRINNKDGFLVRGDRKPVVVGAYIYHIFGGGEGERETGKKRKG